MSDPQASAYSPEQQALLEAINALLGPLASLAVARGVHFGELEERLKVAFIQAARQANPGGLPHRQVSRISTATGINRREVTRLVGTDLQVTRPRRPLAAEVYAHWLTDPIYRDADGAPAALPRQGPVPSFETLARAITSDVHPRSMLAEMLRLGFAVHDPETDCVRAQRDAFVPRDDVIRSLQILGDNVGHHLTAAVVNVLGTGQEHFEQAIVADGLSQESIAAARMMIKAQWRSTFERLVPALERLVEADRAERPDVPKQRLLFGQFSFNQPEAERPSAGDTAQGGEPSP